MYCEKVGMCGINHVTNKATTNIYYCLLFLHLLWNVILVQKKSFSEKFQSPFSFFAACDDA
jgi:hypothetical protein